ncbi:hypothetical protein [Desulfovibrio gilichinskyi]|uniref:Uncharacterized protein n=1 Tax=Desulfovibrio gilichinskyi TaxID=1519643 RepID=A0A1X7C4G7_9BACT|nr:hypothetical protein [Desulfovibrio gilichinskyi]SME89421.1 hypothetical protein SAMN06295933_0298 [Desulfovibrio gilichinskyi]
MQSIPIKTPWKNQKRIFFRRFKKGEPYYFLHEWYNSKDEACSAYERTEAHCNEWYAVVYLGINELDEHAFYSVLGWRPYGSKKDTAKKIDEYNALQKHLGTENVPPYHTPEEFEKAIKAKFAA